ncbi:polyprenyl synthetase family protein [Zhihengliuella sp.]|uniref:polyprenyl synthetase family protein n=1 Tax=Zhihengliuella sp. TaxID=1954483 RepID=UPI00281251CA|nr:polyprenyl synthetase family protein [Zhihengliuella sp.]
MSPDFPAVGAGALGIEDYVLRVGDLLERFLEGQSEFVYAISPDADELVAAIRDLARQGKRLRARFAYLGFLGGGGDPAANDIVRLGASLELFQAAALIHDDLIDRSDTRRGQPSVHRRFEALHRRARWARDSARFGEAAAVLTGDLCLSFSEQLFGTLAAPASTRRVFDAMRAQVMAGQYLDVLEESAGPSHGPEAALARARTVVRFKSAKYSIENPLLLGGTLAGISDDLAERYSAFALPLGEAFQLRDDVLGVFGNPETTGKPAGDDLKEGKRTELVAHALRLAAPEDSDFIQTRLGAEDLRDDEIRRMCSILEDSGALAQTEQSIDRLSERGFAALEDLQVGTPSVRAEVVESLRALGLQATRRKA